MAEVKWIKIVTDIFDDDKILLIESLPDADAIIVIWFKLLCLAGKQNNSGVFMIGNRIAYTDTMLATIFRRKEATVKLALQTFEQFGMIELIDGVITIPNWEKHQSIDKLDKMREQNKKRVAKHRAKQKQIVGCNVTVMQDVTQCNATDKNRLDKNRLDKNRLDKNRLDKNRVDVAVATSDTDYGNIEPEDKLEFFKDGIILSDNQLSNLLDVMGLEIFDEYIARLSDFLQKPGVKVNSHYATLLKWYNEDRGVNA